MKGLQSIRKRHEMPRETVHRKHSPICVKTMQVDGETIKEDTFYRLKNGEFVEVED